VPESLGYAQLAGVPVQFGLYALLGGRIGYAIFGSSRQLVVGPSAGLAAISAATIASLASGGGERYLALTAGLALLAGSIVICVACCGWASSRSCSRSRCSPASSLAWPPPSRYGSCRKLFGIEGGDGNSFQRLWHLVTHLGETHGWTQLIGVASLAILFGLKRFAPRIPESLVALADRHLFLSFDGYPMSESTVQKICYWHSKRTGLHVYPHRFRHTFAVGMLQAGTDLRTLQRLMGRSDIRILARYLNLARDDAIRAH
jgi:hypothetical protein